MSTILKALRRLEEEKSRGVSSRPLREEVASGPREAPRRRRFPWLPILAMVMGAGLGASAWWFWPYERGGQPVREAATGEAAQAEESVVTRRVPPGFNAAAAVMENQLLEMAEGGIAEEDLDAPAPPAEPPQPEDLLDAGGPLPDDAFASQVEVVDRPTPEPRIAPPSPGAPQERVINDPEHVANEPPAVTARRARRAAAAARTEPRPPAQTRVAAAAAPDPVTAVPDPVTEPAPPPPTRVGAPAPAPAPKQAAARTSEPPALRPEPREAEPAPPKPAPTRIAKKSAPAAVSTASEADSSVRVKRTQWHPEPARRSADLDVSGTSASVHEGDLIGEYVVTEIRPSGVVLTRDGQRIERGIGK